MKQIHRKVIRLQARLLTRLASEIGNPLNYRITLAAARGSNYDPVRARQLANSANDNKKASVVRALVTEKKSRSDTYQSMRVRHSHHHNRFYGNIFVYKAIIIRELIGPFNDGFIEIPDAYKREYSNQWVADEVKTPIDLEDVLYEEASIPDPTDLLHYGTEHPDGLESVTQKSSKAILVTTPCRQGNDTPTEHTEVKQFLSQWMNFIKKQS